MISSTSAARWLRAGLRVVARVADQILAADHLEQALPVLGIGAAAEDVDVVVRPAGLARVERRRASARRAATGCCRRAAAPCRCSWVRENGTRM